MQRPCHLSSCEGSSFCQISQIQESAWGTELHVHLQGLMKFCAPCSEVGGYRAETRCMAHSYLYHKRCDRVCSQVFLHITVLTYI